MQRVPVAGWQLNSCLVWFAHGRRAARRALGCADWAAPPRAQALEAKSGGDKSKDPIQLSEEEEERRRRFEENKKKARARIVYPGAEADALSRASRSSASAHLVVRQELLKRHPAAKGAFCP